MEQTQTEAPKITKDMTIGDVLQLRSDKAMKLSEIMTAAGLHCVGCGAATFETLEQGVLGHGFSQEQLDKLVGDLNAALEEEEPTVAQGESPVTLEASAVTKVKELIAKEGNSDKALRVAVLAGGCSGYSYDLSLQSTKQEGDLEFTQDGITVYVDKSSLKMLDGIHVKYVDTLNESGFKFDNPNAKNGCGCGSSFN